MRLGFSFKGRHSREFPGLTVRTSDRPIRAETKGGNYPAANGSGSYSFAEANPYGHEYFEDKIFQMDLQLCAGSISDLQRRLTKISRWITGRGELIFDDTPLVKWQARVIDTVQYRPEHGGTAVLSVKYRVKPYAELIFDSLGGPGLDSSIALDSDIPLDMGEYFVFVGSGTHNVINIGDLPVRPVVTVSGAEKAYSIECNGFTISVPKSAVIDCERYMVTDLQGESLMREIAGDFFEFLPGDNKMTVTGGGKAAFTVEYHPRYIHNADDLEMGFENAEII